MAALPKTASTVSFNEVVTFSVSSINASSFSVETYACNGIDQDMQMEVFPITATAGVRALSARASANNVLEITWANFNPSTAAMGSTAMSVIAQ